MLDVCWQCTFSTMSPSLCCIQKRSCSEATTSHHSCTQVSCWSHHWRFSCLWYTWRAISKAMSPSWQVMPLQTVECSVSIATSAYIIWMRWKSNHLHITASSCRVNFTCLECRLLRVAYLMASTVISGMGVLSSTVTLSLIYIMRIKMPTESVLLIKEDPI